MMNPAQLNLGETLWAPAFLHVPRDSGEGPPLFAYKPIRMILVGRRITKNVGRVSEGYETWNENDDAVHFVTFPDDDVEPDEVFELDYLPEELFATEEEVETWIDMMEYKESIE
jgi:hypothetical protein